MGRSTARMTLELVSLNRNTVRFFFHRLRKIITEEQDKQSPFDDEIETQRKLFSRRTQRQTGQRRWRESTGVWFVKACQESLPGCRS
jgi:hypothetical protein